jgi:hypothetical protein
MSGTRLVALDAGMTIQARCQGEVKPGWVFVACPFRCIPDMEGLVHGDLMHFVINWWSDGEYARGTQSYSSRKPAPTVLHELGEMWGQMGKQISTPTMTLGGGRE